MATYTNSYAEWPDWNSTGMKNRLTKIENSPLIEADNRIKRMKKIKGEFVSSGRYETPYGPIYNSGGVLDQFAKIRAEYENGNVNESVEAILELLENMK